MLRSILPTSVLVLSLSFSATADEGPGFEIFQEQCASCHGDRGQGSEDGYTEALSGDHSVEALTRYIEKAMPEDDPESCVGDEALSVAKYIYDAFYSLEARQREGLVPTPRVELARLTVSQYRNAVADLIGYFTPEPKPNKRRSRGRSVERGERQDTPKSGALPIRRKGLLGEYFQSKGMSKADKEKLKRIDSQIDFDFGEEGPIEEISADQFAIIWQGSLVADATGYYEFRISTQNGARLYLNLDTIERRRRLRDDSSVAGQAALIDEWVSSGKLREPTARVYLLGGRRYPIRLEFFKYKEKDASIKLEWKPPHSSWSVIDHRHLRSQMSRRTYVVDTPFPADDRSLGFERGNSISRQWHAATSTAAVAAANEVIARLPILAGITENSENREARLKEFVVRFATVAFRRPLSELEENLLRSAPFQDAPNVETAARRALLMVLNAPQFLYTELSPPNKQPPQNTIASRLSLAIWDSIPDQELLDAANANQLSTSEQITKQARRMLSDPRARSKMREFFHHWLEIEERDLAKDKVLFPEFDESVITDLRYSLESFIEDVVWSTDSDYRELLQSNQLVLNDRLKKLYAQTGVDKLDADNRVSVDETAGNENADEAGPRPTSPTDGRDEKGAQHGSINNESHDATNQQVNESEYTTVDFPADQRAGILTHPYLLSAFAYHNNTSPIHRGVFLTRNIVGRELKPPPVAVAFKDDEFDPNLTMREKITELTRDAACISCHSVINPLGFTLENFDAVGRWRTVENDKPVETESEYTTRDGKTITIRNARDVADFAVASEGAHRAFVRQLFHHLIKQPPGAYGPKTLNRLREAFEKDDYNIQNLVVQIAATAAVRGLEISD